MSGVNFIKIEDPESITKKIYRVEINSEIERINKELVDLKTVYNYAGMSHDDYIDWKGKYESYKNKLVNYKKQKQHQTFFTMNEDPEVPSFGGRVYKHKHKRSKKQLRKRRSTLKRR